MNFETRMPLKHKPQDTRKTTFTPQQEININPVNCINKNKLWKGEIIPLIPIQRNYFIIHEEHQITNTSYRKRNIRYINIHKPVTIYKFLKIIEKINETKTQEVT